MKARIIIITLFLGLFAISLNAQSVRHHPAKRHELRKSVRQGDLNRGERYHLNRQQQRIDRSQRLALRDGHVGPAERRHIKHLKAKQRRHYYAMKHNKRRRF